MTSFINFDSSSSHGHRLTVWQVDKVSRHSVTRRKLKLTLPESCLTPESCSRLLLDLNSGKFFKDFYVAEFVCEILKGPSASSGQLTGFDSFCPPKERNERDGKLPPWGNRRPYSQLWRSSTKRKFIYNPNPSSFLLSSFFVSKTWVALRLSETQCKLDLAQDPPSKPFHSLGDLKCTLVFRFASFAYTRETYLLINWLCTGTMNVV